MIKTNTWLPVFSGFYNTIWEGDDEYLCSDIEEQCKEKGYSEKQTEEMTDFIWRSEYYSRMNREYQKEVTKELAKELERVLKELKIIDKLTHQAVVSPREYNFVNDSVNIQVRLKKSHVNRIKKYLKDNYAPWEDYLKERYSHRDGFYSYHDNYPESPDWCVDNAVKDEHRLGSILNFICLHEHQDDLTGYADFEHELYDTVRGNVFYDLCLDTLEEEKQNS